MTEGIFLIFELDLQLVDLIEFFTVNTKLAETGVSTSKDLATAKHMRIQREYKINALCVCESVK